MFIGTAYSQETVTTVSAREIITKGKIISEGNKGVQLAVLYKKEMYLCRINFDEMFCMRPQDRGVIIDY
tara:strand:+ start:183 stop:389 length:207 start_codon:yes stop_codon:yes gene_type:complete